MREDLLTDVTEESLEEEPVPLGLRIWGMAVRAILVTIFFVLISCIAIAIDVALHWFASLPLVAKYGLSPIIRWEVELVAYTFATVGTLLLLRMLIQPVVEFAWRVTKRS